LRRDGSRRGEHPGKYGRNDARLLHVLQSPTVRTSTGKAGAGRRDPVGS
jgi:hypothetical protein